MRGPSPADKLTRLPRAEPVPPDCHSQTPVPPGPRVSPPSYLLAKIPPKGMSAGDRVLYPPFLGVLILGLGFQGRERLEPA